ncbi:MAG: WYL domain-containing protein [Pseudobutyrivibrio sp.]|nr:WYL domain-containing protein [Pseudobutyrivibrio sp.]
MPNVGGQKYKILIEYQILTQESDENNQINAVEMTRLLAERGISAERKGIYKDMDTLIEAGVDIIKGDKGYYIGSRTFELAELKLLVDAVGASKFISEKKSKGLVEKICTLASPKEANQLKRQVVVPNKTRSGNEKIFYTIDVIYNCIDEGKQMVFKYQEWTLDKEMKPRHGGKDYHVSPAFLLRNDENYYLVALDEDSQEIRHYRVDRMLSASLYNQPISRTEEMKNLNPKEYAKKHVSMFAGEEKIVTVKCPAHLLGVVLDKFGKDIDVRLDQDKEIRARIPVAVSPQLYGWLTGIGAVIVSPKSEADAFRDYIKELLNKF